MAVPAAAVVAAPVAAPAATTVITVAAPAVPASLQPSTNPLTEGIVTVFGVSINPMLIILALGIAALLFFLWRAQQDRSEPFNAWDLIMENGRASISRVTFGSAFLMTTWVIVDQETKHSLTEGLFGAYLLAWVGPLVARVIFNKTDPTTSYKPEVK